MPEDAVIEAPATPVPSEAVEAPFKHPDYPKGDLTFGFSEETPEGRPRDDKGRFVKPGVEVPETPPVEEVPKTEEAPEAAVVVGSPGLAVDDAVPPTFGFDGKFVGGKFIGKHDTIDDALQGYKGALKRIGQLEYELSRARDGAPDVGPPYVDTDSMTPDQIEKRIADEIGVKEEMSYEDRVAYEENPARYLASMLVKGKKAMEKVTAEMTRYNESWERNTKAAYPKLYDKAHPLGKTIWAEVRRGKIKLPELMVLLGAGVMAREGMLSGEEPVTRVKPVGRASETRAAVPVASPPKKGPSESAAYLKQMQDARYG